MPEQVVLEYGGFSLARGRCHVVFDPERSHALVGEPLDNPGTAVTNAIEEVAFSLKTSLGIDVSMGQLFQYTPWDAEIRRERTLLVKFHGDMWSMPVWTDPDATDAFLVSALAEVHAIKPYTLTKMSNLTLVLSIVRVRVDAAGVPGAHLRLSDVGTVEHISQRRYYYLDVRAPTEEAAVAAVYKALGGEVPNDRIEVTTPNAPLDQPGSLPV